MNRTVRRLDIHVSIPDTGVMDETEAAGNAARRAALFGAASGRHRTVQPVPRQTVDATSTTIDLATAPAILAADHELLLRGNLGQLEQQVIAILAASKQRTPAEIQAGELAGDGGIAIDSMSAVFVCRIVSRVLKPEEWTTLRGNCAPEDFISVTAVARLIDRLRRAKAIV